MLFIRFVGICMLVASMSTQIFATTADELAKATDRDKTVFLLVFEPNAQGLEPAREMVNTAAQQVKKSTVIQLDRADATNSALVAKYRLTAAPLPLIMVLAGNGAIAGGIPAANTTAEQLVKYVPTAKKAEALKAIQEGQSVLAEAFK